MTFSTNQQIVVDLFIAAYGRAPAQGGLDYFTGKLDSGEMNSYDIATYMADASPEAAIRFPSTGTTAEKVNSIFQNVLGRGTATQEGLDYWSARVDNESGYTLATLMHDVINSAKTQTVDAQTLANKSSVVEYFLSTVPASEQAGKQVSTDSILTTADVDSAKQQIDVMAEVTGETIFVTGDNLFNGTADNDTFIATRGKMDSSIIDGKEGTDRLNSTIDANASLTSYNLENVFLRNTSSSESTVDLLEANGLVEIWNDRSGGDLELTGVSKDVTVGVKETSTKTTVNYNDVTGTNDAIAVKLDGSKDGAELVATGVETLNLNVTSDSYLNVSNNAGLKNIAITSSSATTIKVDGDADMTITGGEGEDTLILNGALGTDLEMSGIEKLAVDASATLDLDNVNVNEIISLDGDLVVTNVESEILVVAGTTTSLDATVKTGTDTVFVDVQESANETATTLALDSNTKALSLSGDGIAKFTNALTVETIDASVNTAGVDIVLGDAIQTITGTAQADVFDFGTFGTEADTLDGGAGEDMVKFEVNGGDQKSVVTSNIEIADVTFTTDNILDAENLTDTTLIKTSGTGTLSNISAGTSVEITDDASLTISLKSDTSTDSLNVLFSKEGDQTITALNVDKIESLNLSNNDGKVTITDALTNTSAMEINLSSGLDSEFKLSASNVAETIKFDGTTIGNVVIDDFTAGIGITGDDLDFSIYGVDDISDLTISTVGGNTIIDITDDANFGEVKLIGVDHTTLTDANFDFA